MSKILIETISFGEATHFMKYHAGSEERFRNQVEFIKAAIGEKQYLNLRVVSLEESNPSANSKYLIVVTGSRNDFHQRLNSQTTKDIFDRVHPGKEFKDMWSDGVVADTPDPGNVLTSLQPFNELRDEINKGWYSIHEILQDI